MDKITISFTIEELSVLVEMMNSMKPRAGRRGSVFHRIRGDLQLALATALEDEDDEE